MAWCYWYSHLAVLTSYHPLCNKNAWNIKYFVSKKLITCHRLGTVIPEKSWTLMWSLWQKLQGCTETIKHCMQQLRNVVHKSHNKVAQYCHMARVHILGDFTFWISLLLRLSERLVQNEKLSTVCTVPLFHILTLNDIVHTRSRL